MSLPRHRRHFISSHAALLVCCFIFAGVFASPRPAARAADAAKDAQQDEHLVAIDARMDQRDKDRDRISARRDAEYAALQADIASARKDNVDLAKQVANDEGKAEGAFIFIGLLAGSGVFIGFKVRKA